jgi:hypothetical protein
MPNAPRRLRLLSFFACGPAAMALLVFACEESGGLRNPVSPVQYTSIVAAPMSKPPAPSMMRRMIVAMTSASVTRVPLFPDERAALRKAGFEFLQQKYPRGTLIPLDELDRLSALVREGRSTPDGPICAAPSSFSAILEHTYPNALHASVNASCYEPPCMLSVSVFRGADYTEFSKWQTQVAEPSALANWRNAFSTLSVPPPRRPGGVGGVLGSSSEPDPRLAGVDEVRSFGAWRTLPTPAAFVNVQPALDACHQTWRSSGPQEGGALEVARDGTVSRCALDLEEKIAGQPEREICLCGALSQVRFETGTGERRLAIMLMHQAEPMFRQGTIRFGANYEQQVRTEPSSEVGPNFYRTAGHMAKCFTASNQTGTSRVRIQVQVQPTGHVQFASANVASPLKNCIETELAKAAFPCSASGMPFTVTAQLQMYALRDDR